MVRFRSGKLPKVFKVVPKMANWEELMWLTQPDSWSPAATWMVRFFFVKARASKHSNAKRTDSCVDGANNAFVVPGRFAGDKDVCLKPEPKNGAALLQLGFASKSAG